jgi:ADP-ribose pyrophosphatase
VPFRRVGEREIHHGHVISLAVGAFEAPDGTRFEREIVHHPGAVSVVPVDGDDVVLVRQYRAAVDAELLEIPAGKRDKPGEDPASVARRELAEEIGMEATDLVLLCRFFNSPGFCDEDSATYLATGLRAGQVDLQGIEEQHMTIERVPLSAVPGLIDAGEIRDAKTIIGLLLARARLGTS